MTWHIDAALLSDAGAVRGSNEDAGRIVRPGDPGMLASRGVLAIVADGMGGHQAGEVASRMAVDIVHQRYYALSGSPDQALVAAFAEANRAIYERAQRDRRHAGMGTTCVALAVCDGRAYASHAGDSRLYLARGGGMYQMTTDDSAVGEMVSRGVLTRQAARRHEDRNVILKAIGTHAVVEVSSWQTPMPVQPGDTFLLCSDGLTDLVEDEELAAAVTGQPAGDACRALIDLAKSRGGFDNITAAVLRFAPQPVRQTPVRETQEVRVTP